MTTAKDIGRAIRLLREHRGLSQKDVEDLPGGMARPMLSRIENGHRMPTVESLDAIATLLGVPLSKLLRTAETLARDGDASASSPNDPQGTNTCPTCWARVVNRPKHMEWHEKQRQATAHEPLTTVVRTPGDV